MVALDNIAEETNIKRIYTHTYTSLCTTYPITKKTIRTSSISLLPNIHLLWLLAQVLASNQWPLRCLCCWKSTMGGQVLQGHMMKNTDHHNGFVKNKDVLAVFKGPHAYVSGSWYSQPHTASTWNYMSVQVTGVMRFLDDSGLAEIMRKTTLLF